MILPSPQEEKLFKIISFYQFQNMSYSSRRAFTGILRNGGTAVHEEALYNGITYKIVWSSGKIEYWLNNKSITYSEYLSHTKEFKDVLDYKNIKG